MSSAFILLLSLLSFTSASPRIQKREVCTVESLNNPLLDDVPAITSALKKCGSGERIVLAKGTTYTIRSPLDLSPCRACDFQINGLVNVSRDWNYWQKQTAVFKFSNASAAMIRSEENTGVIDAQYLGLTALSSNPPMRIPKLFSISDESYQIYIRDLMIKNVPGTVFYVNSHSSAVRFYGIDIKNAATTGYLVEQSQHVYLWNNTIRANGSCVALLPNSTNVQVEESTCIIAGANTESSGIQLQLLASTGLGWIRNIFVRKVTAVGGMNVIAFQSGQKNGEANRIEITNATFTDVIIEGPARRAVYLAQGNAMLNATKVAFKNFQGKAEKESTLTCANPKDVCDFKTEDWNVVTQS